MDYQKHLPTPSHSRTYWLTEWLFIIHQVRHLLGLQQRPNQRRRRMESSFHHQRRTIWTYRHVLRTHQFSRNISDDDELDLLRRNSRTMANRLHGWYGNTHEEKRGVNQITTHPSPQILCMSNPHETPQTQSLPQTGEMHIRTTIHQILRSPSKQRICTHGQRQSRESSQLVPPFECHGSPQIPRIHRLLPLLHQGLLENSKTFITPHTQRDPLAMERRTTTSF